MRPRSRDGRRYLTTPRRPRSARDRPLPCLLFMLFLTVASRAACLVGFSPLPLALLSAWPVFLQGAHQGIELGASSSYFVQRSHAPTLPPRMRFQRLDVRGALPGIAGGRPAEAIDPFSQLYIGSFGPHGPEVIQLRRGFWGDEVRSVSNLPLLPPVSAFWFGGSGLLHVAASDCLLRRAAMATST